jgi:hypothetical protein
MLELPAESSFNYDELDRIDQILAELLSCNAQLLYTDVHRDEIVKLQKRIKQFKRQLDEHNRQFAVVKDSFDVDRQADVDRVKEEQGVELNETEAYFAQELPPKFRKWSTTLVALRSHEKKLRRAGQFIEAKKVRAELVALEQAEMDANQRRWENARLRELSNLRKRHERQLVCLHDRWDRQWQTIEPSSIATRNHLQKVIDTNQERLNEVLGCKNDFHVRTTRSVINAKREQLPQLTARKGQFESPRSVTGRPQTPGSRMAKL